MSTAGTTTDMLHAKGTFYSMHGADGLTAINGDAQWPIPIQLSTPELGCFGDGPNGGSNIAFDSQNLAIITWSAATAEDGVCGDDGEPLSWRIQVASIDPNGKPSPLREFATGRSTLAVRGPDYSGPGSFDCRCARLPNVSLSNGLIAYNIDNPTAADPFGSQIVVRSLASGSVVRTLTTPTFVANLQLSESNLAWIEFDGDYAGSLRLRASAAANPVPQDVAVLKTPAGSEPWNLPYFDLAGTSLTWEGFSTGKIWLRDLATAGFRQISPAGTVCRLMAFDGTGAAMGCGSDTTVPTWSASFRPDWLVFWSPSAGDRLLVGTPAFNGNYSCDLTNGVLSVTFDEDSAATLWTVPVSALTGS